MKSNKVIHSSIPEKHRQLLELIFDKFAKTGKWPNSREIQVAFFPNDYWTIIEEIDFHLLRNRGSKSEPASVSVLSIEGIALCKKSDRHIQLFLRALEKCVETFVNDPQNATITPSDLRDSLTLDSRDASVLMEMLLVANRIWSNASYGAQHELAQFVLFPDVLKYKGVADFSQYLYIVDKNRPKRSYVSKDSSKLPKSHKVYDYEFSSLHPQISQRCEKLFFDEHYSEAVEASFKVVRDKLRQLTGFETGSEAFGKGKLHIVGAAAQNVDRDFNKGVKFLLMAIDYFRNEKSHTSNDQIKDPRHAMDYLCVSSLAIKFLDGSDVSHGQPKKSEAEIALEKAKHSFL